MDYMDSGMRYTPKSDKDWDTSVQFLPASDNKKLEKKKGPGKVGAVIGVVIFAAVVALMTGLLVWHFHFRKDVRVKRMYTGSMRITNQAFQEAYENSNSSEFKALAKQVTSQLKGIYTKSPQLAKYYVGSTVQAFSEGSVIAYYLSEFSVPTGQENTVDNAMTSLEKLVVKERSGVNRPGNSLVFEDVVSSAIDARLFSASFSRFYRYQYHIKTNQPVQIQSFGFPETPYLPRTYNEWRLRADPGYIIKLNFDTIDLEENCTNDFIKIYDSLSNIESRAMQKLCGAYPPSEPTTFLSSSNVMLVTMVTNEKDNYIGFRALASQVKRGGKETTCGGRVKGDKGSFTSPNFPNYYPPNSSCKWSIEVPTGKGVKVTFKTFLVSESGQQRNQGCGKSYVMVNGKRLCGEHADGELTETKNTNTVDVDFISDFSYVDQGFLAEFEAIDIKDPCPRQFGCRNQRCIRSMLQCDGWNDCGDMSDEMNCKCDNRSIKCDNGLCKPKFWKCDDVDDCGDGTDERDCGRCESGQFTCKNNKCVSEKKRCDGRDDCADGSDELDCPTNTVVRCTDLTFRCKNNKCISKLNPECDGLPDCEDGSDEENCDCGRSMFKTSRIVGGQNAEEGEYPWQVSLQDKKGGHVCGASVISSKWIVTAAHCVKVDGQPRYSQPSMWDAYFGLHTQRKIDSNVVKRSVTRIIPHPYYNTFTFDNDIALMEMESPVQYSKYIRPICLPAAQHVFPVGQTVSITGWGATREGGFAATVLQKAQVRIINHTVCDNLMGGQLTSRMLCAGVLSGGVDACQGDSGGPLSSPSGSRMFLAGVVSWGDGCARRNKPGIYTTVTKFRGWIQQQTGV